MEASGASLTFPDPFEFKYGILSAIEAIWILLLLGSQFLMSQLRR